MEGKRVLENTGAEMLEIEKKTRALSKWLFQSVNIGNLITRKITDI